MAYQRRGIGKRLIEETRANAGPEATLVLLSAPSAESYYPKIGMKKHGSCWTIARSR
ncbi:MAG TPA: GNAT family N-acetyltransferase [Methylovirgula sp.]